MTGSATAALIRAGQGLRAIPALVMTAREFLRRPVGVGSAFPASTAFVNAALAPVDLSRARVVVEYGPGAGPFTRALLRQMPDDSQLVTIDVSERFTRFLRETIPDPRLSPVTGSAASLPSVLKRLGLGPVDCIVTGIPFSTMTQGLAERIVDVSADALADDGQMIAYQMRGAIGKLLPSRFASVRTSRSWMNVPPCRIYWATGPTALHGQP